MDAGELYATEKEYTDLLDTIDQIRTPSGIAGGIRWAVEDLIRNIKFRDDIIGLSPGGYVLRYGSWRPTKAHEYIFQLTKSARYFCDAQAVAQRISGTATRNPRDVWTFSAEPAAWDFCGGCRTLYMKSDRRKIEVRRDGRRKIRVCPTCECLGESSPLFPSVAPLFPAAAPLVLDPFAGSGRTLIAAVRLGCHASGIELNPDYVALAGALIGQGGAESGRYEQRATGDASATQHRGASPRADRVCRQRDGVEGQPKPQSPNLQSPVPRPQSPVPDC